MVRLSALVFLGSASGFFWMQPLVDGAEANVAPEITSVFLDGVDSSPAIRTLDLTRTIKKRA
jgi:hypothetical protein